MFEFNVEHRMSRFTANTQLEPLDLKDPECLSSAENFSEQGRSVAFQVTPGGRLLVAHESKGLNFK